MADLDCLTEAFLEEADELLAEVEDTVLNIEQNPEDMDAVNKLFRVMHTIKGSGAMVGLKDLADFTHHVENALDKVRKGQLPASKALIDQILTSRDQIKAMLEAVEDGTTVELSDSERIIDALTRIMDASASSAKAAKPDDPSAEQETKQAEQAEAEEPEEQAGDDPSINKTASEELEIFDIMFRPYQDVLKSGIQPAMLIDDLRSLGECLVDANLSALPALEQMDPTTCYISWKVMLTTNKGLNAVKDVFIFIDSQCDLEIQRIASGISPNIYVACSLLEEDTADGLVDQAPQRRVELFVGTRGNESGPRPSPCINRTPSARKTMDTKSGTVRVPSDKLDLLINLVGELVITQARLTQVASTVEALELATPVEEIERLSAELRDSVLNMRMMPIGVTFSKFKRLVRDLSAELGKEISLAAEGAETELDKTVIDRLGDPLVHLIRNSIDHGVEPPDEREKAGKPRRGTIRLSAEHKGATVVISIEDDGKGLNKNVIREKAVERGLVSRDADLSEKEIFFQIFQPGFSTAKTVSNVSGRGVGMDVVKREIEALRGSIDINSTLGEGTTIELSLPLTLAIIDGLLVSVKGDHYVIPVSLVDECVELSCTNHALSADRNVIRVRDDMIPYVRLRDVFHLNGKEPTIEQTVIVHCADFLVGLVVDEVIGQHQTVIKSLGKLYQDVEGVSGATILGDGTVALILDVPGLVRCSEREEATHCKKKDMSAIREEAIQAKAQEEQPT